MAACLIGLAFAADPGPYPRDDKDAARDWVWKWWPKGHELNTGFTGSYENGIPGETSAEWKEAMVTRMNFFRRMQGESPVTLNAEYSRLCQAGAILILSDFSHAPAKTAKNWTQDGFTAAQHSQLSGNNSYTNPIMGLIYDYGNPNLGHRSAIFAPGLKTVGVGAANKNYDALPELDRAEAKLQKPYRMLLWDSDPSFETVDPAFTEPFVLWPAEGWVPTKLIPANWSVDVSDYWNGNVETGSVLDLRGVTIEVWRNGIKMPVAGGSDTGGFLLRFAIDGTDVNSNPYKEGGSGKVVGGVQTPYTNGSGDNNDLFCHDFMHGEHTAYGLNAATENPFGDVIYDVKISGIKVRATGALWKGTGVYQYQVKGFDLQAARAVAGQAKLINISTRSAVKTGSGVQIGGFVVSGTKPCKVLVRGSGPAMAEFGVQGLLPDPKLSLYKLEGDTQILVGSNDNWSDDPAKADEIEAVRASVGAFPWVRGSKDAAIVATLEPGNYTGVVEGAHGETGNGLVEVYSADADAGDAKLTNISSRTFVGDQGDDYQIAGFILKGDKPRTVLIRVSGRDLEQFGVSDVLRFCQFELYAGQSRVGDGPFPVWDDNSVRPQRLTPAFQEVGAFPLTKRKGAAAHLFTLLPNVPYTVVVKAGTLYSGLNDTIPNTKGNALIEVYEYP